MSTKADLRVILGIDKAGFDRSLASATASVNRFAKRSQMAKKDIGAHFPPRTHQKHSNM
jgi:hypothetical protein